MADLRPVEAITFDCYGTLIDWGAGVEDALLKLINDRGGTATGDELLIAFGEVEREVEDGSYIPYRAVCAEVSERLAQRFGATLQDGEARFLAMSLEDWPAFDETPDCLLRLQAKYRLGIVSNIDNDLFEGSAPKLGVTPDAVVTAQIVRSYKPNRAHFDRVLEDFALTPDRILHVGASRFHDVEPAKAMGFNTCLIKRDGGDVASGAGDAEPDLTCGSLTELCAVLGV
ncbi:MAG: HAD-IA family hydrolase [Planctomycetota bacterium]